jgi:transposase
MSRFSGVRAMVLADEQWAALKPALDAVRPGTGRPLADERLTLDGMVWRLRNGARWRVVPAEYGPWWRPAQLHIRRSEAGVWERLFERLRDAGRPDVAEVVLDGTVVRAHHKAAGAPKKGGPAGSGTGARRSAARAAASGPRPARRATPPAGRSRSRCCPARPRS